MAKQYSILHEAFKERDRLLNVVKGRYDEEVKKLADMSRTNTENINSAVRLEKQFEVQKKQLLDQLNQAKQATAFERTKCEDWIKRCEQE